jgi:type II secretory pathway pseudopilin PulG
MRYHSLARRLPQNFCKSSEAGFTYLGLLILLVIIGIVSATALQMGVAMQRRVAEEALLDVGREFSRALESYRLATPSGQPDEPEKLQDLLKDPRFPGTVRHLRKVYSDPIMGQQEWGILRSEDSGRIVGLFSLSDAKPIKIANFDLRLQEFAGKSSYQQWVFSGQQANATSGSRLVNPLDLMDQPEASPATDSSTDIPRMSNGYINPIDLRE